MTPADLNAFGKARYGDRWIRPLSAELGFHFSTIWRAARGAKPVSREIEQGIRLLPRKAKKSTTSKDPSQ